MGLYHCIEELFSKAYGDGLFRVTKVTDDRHIILCRSLPYHSVQLFLFLRIVVYHPTARYYIMRKVLYRIILRRIAELACFRVHLNQSILFPSPGAGSIVGQKEVPVEPFVASVAGIVADQEKGVLARFPVHAAVAAFALRADVMVIGILTAYFRQYLTAFPLESDAVYALTQLPVG